MGFVKKIIVFSALLFMVISLYSNSPKKLIIDLESGWLLPGYNNVQIPRNSGTRFSLKNDLSIQEKLFYRIRLSYSLGLRHQLSALYAPLSLTASGNLPQDILFEGINFNKNDAVNALYRFNSYRLTYRYTLINKPKFNFRIGLSAKIRDAEIAITSTAQHSSKTNVGFVPLLNFMVDWQWNNQWGMLFEADAAAAKQGRAEDAALHIYYQLTPALKFKAGYRLVEGGADVEEVYNFALINYLSAGFTISL
jgi:hypothetical protein